MMLETINVKYGVLYISDDIEELPKDIPGIVFRTNKGLFFMFRLARVSLMDVNSWVERVLEQGSVKSETLRNLRGRLTYAPLVIRWYDQDHEKIEEFPAIKICKNCPDVVSATLGDCRIRWHCPVLSQLIKTNYYRFVKKTTGKYEPTIQPELDAEEELNWI